MSQNKSLSDGLAALPRWAKQMLAIGSDAVACCASVIFAYYLRTGMLPPASLALAITLALALAVTVPIFVVMGLYRAIFRYSGAAATRAIVYAVAIAAAPMVVLLTIVGVHGVPRTIGILQPILMVLFVLLSRLLVREWFGAARGRSRAVAAIYGAGAGGRELARALATGGDFEVAVYLDDNPELHGRTIDGVKVVSPDALATYVADKRVRHVLLAVPSASRRRRKEIVADLRKLPVKIQTLPSVADIAHGRVQIADVRDLDIDDLLGRDAVAPDPALMDATIRGRVVMVTGAGGSIGSELCRQILLLAPARLLLFEMSEFALYQVHRELEGLCMARGIDCELVPLIGSIRDQGRLAAVMEAWRPHTLYHAAAYKHVPLVEHNVAEGFLNNVVGTRALVAAARAAGVRDFVLISTDKAVRPTNVMGATKRLAEMLLQYAATEAGGCTRFSMVRFGNVLNSSGSVVPLFRRQIEAGGPVTVTHPEVTRYFMTIPEAAQLVLQAGGMAALNDTGGEVFVLDMGEPVKIVDLARTMIELSGLAVRCEANPLGDIAIEFVGLRPGEKLYEELLIGDNPQPTAHPRIMKARERLLLDRAAFDALLADIERAACAGAAGEVRELLKRIVAGYRPDSCLVDLVELAPRQCSASAKADVQAAE